MQILEYPYILIIFAAGCVLLAAIGFYFVARCIKTADGHDEASFVSVSKLESVFGKAGKQRRNRAVLYIALSSESIRGEYTEPNVLSELRTILLRAYSDGDSSVITMYGNNAFLAVTKWDTESVRETIEQCHNEVSRCLKKYHVLNVVDVRTGVHFAVGTDVSFDESIERAKQAWLLAKDKKLSFVEWNVTNGKALEQKRKIENTIEKEIDNNRFFLEYQPVLDAASGTIIGAEVLSRLNSETDGVLSPGRFLSAVESVGLNDKFDYYIFEKNCKWIANNKEAREKYLYTINFSRSTLCDESFAEKVMGIAGQYGLNLSCLAVEILEDKEIVGEARGRMVRNLSVLKEHGVSVLLDDFGNGYTAFTDLQSLDVSVVKIDKSITQKAMTDTGYIILKNIIRTAADLGFKTLCEGIETPEQESAAKRAGCDYLQGFYYYKPMSAAALEQLFDEGRE